MLFLCVLIWLCLVAFSNHLVVDLSTTTMSSHKFVGNADVQWWAERKRTVRKRNLVSLQVTDNDFKENEPHLTSI